MFEYVIVLGVVLAAAIYVARRLWRQLKGRGCEDCDCPEKKQQANRVVQVETEQNKKK